MGRGGRHQGAEVYSGCPEHRACEPELEVSWLPMTAYMATMLKGRQSFKSDRYLGANKDSVRANRLIHVLPVEPVMRRGFRWDTALRLKFEQLFWGVRCSAYYLLGIRK